MSTKTVFHKVRSITVSETYLLHAVFTDGTEKMYDMRQLEHYPMFDLLFRHPAFIRSVHIEPGGYGISWNDQIDISAEELWCNGITRKS